MKRLMTAVFLTWILLGSLSVAAVAQDEIRGPGVEEAKAALEAFIGAWNTADNAVLRETMNFPFVSLFGTRVIVADEPEQFSTDFAGMRSRNDWHRSAFDFDTLQILAASAERVHCAIDFHRYTSTGEDYMQGRVMYIVTKQGDRWGLQMRTPIGGGIGMDDAAYEVAFEGAKQAVLDFFVAFNSGDREGVSRPLNYPHVFMTQGGLAQAGDSSARSVRPDFDRMRDGQGWHMSTIDSLSADHVSANTVHMNLVFSRWHLDGTRYWTVPALWILTRHDGHWGIQLRSLLPATFGAIAQ